MDEKLSEEDRQRLLQDIDQWCRIKAKLPLDWVRRLVELAEHLANPSASVQWHEANMFWIKLYGVLDELTAYYKNGMALTESVPHISHIKEDLAPVYHRCLSVRQALSEDELLYAEYRRHTIAHIWQEGYSLKVAKKGLADKRKSALLGKFLGKEDIVLRLRAFVRGYDLNETKIAIEFAQRLLVPLKQLLIEMIARPL